MRDPMTPVSDSGDPGSSGRIPFSQQAWTLDTLKVHFDAMIAGDRRYFSDLLSVQEQTNRDRFTQAEKAVQTAFTAADKAVQAAMAASEKAVLKAENAAEKRAEASNEIRGAMVDAQSHFADKAETDRRLKMLENAHIAASNKSIGAAQLWALAAGIIVVVAAIMAMVFGFAGSGT